MLERLQSLVEMAPNDDGFTLIELLVVIIIIGILAAIAIPVFLNQRNKAYDAQAKEDLHSMATAEETYLTDNNAYTTSFAALQAVGAKQSANVTDSVVGVNGAQSYCLQSVSQSGVTWYLGSATGGPTTVACTTS